MGLLPMPSFHTTVRTAPYTAVPSNRLNSQSDLPFHGPSNQSKPGPSFPFQVLVCQGRGKHRTPGHPPVAFTRACALLRQVFGRSQFPERLVLGHQPFPSLPVDHTDAPSDPFVDISSPLRARGQSKVVAPA